VNCADQIAGARTLFAMLVGEWFFVLNRPFVEEEAVERFEGE
jgi:hypothetical protein